MTGSVAARKLDVDLLVRELGNWRTANRSGPAYHGLADAVRLLIVDGRVPVGARLPSERALADALRVSRGGDGSLFVLERAADEGFGELEEPGEDVVESKKGFDGVTGKVENV